MDKGGSDEVNAMTALAELRVVDLGVGMASALVAKQLREFGARIVRVEPPSGDPFYDIYPAYRSWHRGSRIASAEELERLLGEADVCILGGEDFPDMARPEWDSSSLAEAYPQLIILDMKAASNGSPRAPAAVDILIQARLGIVNEQSASRPIVSAFPMPSYGAALLGLIGVLSCLIERQHSGLGQIVTSSLEAGGTLFWGPFWMSAEKGNEGFRSITPRDVRHLTLRCANDDFIQITMAVPGALAKVHAVLEIPGDVNAEDRGMPSHSRGPEGFFGDVALFDRHSRKFDSASLLTALREQGIPAEAVLEPGDCWTDPQMQRNELIVVDPEGWRSVGNPIRLQPSAVRARAAVKAEGPLVNDPAPLAGIRVMDCGIFVAGPFAAKLLSDYGADVIRVEPPSGRTTLSGERTIITANFGKRAICVDAKTPEGREIVERLSRTVDIAAHNFRPGVAQRLGLDPEALRANNPELITLETTAYGSEGPKSLAPGFDMVIQAHCGLQSRAGGEGNLPLCTRTPIVDFAAGAVGAVALLAAVYEKRQSGAVLSAETSLLNVGAWMVSELLLSPDGGRHGAPRLDAGQRGIHPCESLYQTSDGWIAIAARSDEMARALADFCGFSPPASRRSWGAAERGSVADKVAKHSTLALMEMFEIAGVWAEPCQLDAWCSEDALAEIVREFDDAEFGRVRHCIGPVLQFSRSRVVPSERLSTPSGADTEEILEYLGFSPSQREALIERGIVK